MWIWIFSILLTVGVWVAGYFLEWPLSLEVLLTGVVFVFILSWLVGRRVRASLKARALERELLRQAEQQALNARPDRRAEILELQAQMQRGIAALRGSRLASREGGALYTLPWYMIIGPPGAGKTTALKHSGLVFPYHGAGSGGGVRGVGGTRNCDWWFTNEAILLDTAGRWATEADDRDEWLAFLDMLRRFRSKRPINGVILAISVTDLMEANEEQLNSFARRLRARFDEMTTRLQMVVPAYVMFTKTDLVAGFVEFWGELSKAERAQVWGVTFPLAEAELRDIGSAFDLEFDLLVSTLHSRALRRIGSARQPETRQRVYQFPLEFAALKGNLRAFVDALMQPNAFQEAPILRGVYFSSGTQEGRPVDRVIGGMRRAFNLVSAGASMPPGQTEAKSYFVGDVFERVVIPDKAVASRTRKELRRQRLQRAALSGFALSLAAAVLVPCIYTFAENLAYLRDSKAIAERSQTINWNEPGPILGKVHRLDDLRLRLDELRLWRKGAPLRLGWGMYSGDALYEALRGVYVSSLQVQFADPTRTQIERELRVNAEGAKLVRGYGACFDQLRAYIEMSSPDRIEPEWVSSTLTDVWARMLGAPSAEIRAALAPHVEHYVALVQNHEAAPWTIDPNLVHQVQSLLKQTPDAELDYSALIDLADRNAEPIRRQTIFMGSKFLAFVTSKSQPELVVRGAFTKPGWEAVVRDRIDLARAKHMAEGRWVLGDSEELGVEHSERALQELRKRYFSGYREAWRAFLSDFDLRRPQSAGEALDELNALTESPSPYSRLFNVLADNTRLEAPAPSHGGLTSMMDQAMNQVRQSETAQKVLGDSGAPAKARPWSSPVEDDFRSLVDFAAPPAAPSSGGDAQPVSWLSHYLEQVLPPILSKLQDLKDAQTAPDPHELDEAFVKAREDARKLVETTRQTDLTEPILRPLLMNPISFAQDFARKPIAGEADRKWGLDVWQAWHDKLEGHYPFADGQDATLSDYVEFFKPEKGILWAFYNESLQSTLERNGDVFVPAPQAKWMKYSPELLQCYTKGAIITKDTFSEAADAPLVEFDANVHSVSETVSEVAFEVDGARGTYKNTPEEWFHVQWPSKDPKKRGATLRVRGYDSLDETFSRPGDFGLFRMLDSANALERGTGGGRAGGAATVVAKWSLGSQNAWVRMDIRPSKASGVFSSYLDRHARMFLGFRCPSHLAVDSH